MSKPLLPFATFAAGALVVACAAAPAPTPPVSPTATAPPTTTTTSNTAPAPSVATPVATPPSDVPATGPSPSKKIFVKHDPAWAACHATYVAVSKDLVAESLRAGKGCEAVTKMHPILKPEKGTQSDRNPSQEVKFEGKAGTCYRVYAMADAGIKDLDLLLKDSTGAVAAEDSTDDSSPVLAEDGAICFSELDDVTLVVSVGAGKGSWALQIWSDEPQDKRFGTGH